MDKPVGSDRQHRALGALREERDRALDYLDAVNPLILSLDRRGRVTLLNRFGRELLGYSEAELIGRDWFETCVPQPAGMEDGCEATRRIRDIRPHLPVIGQSAHALAQECDACLAAGMVACLSKPLAVDALVRQLDDLLPIRRGPNRGAPVGAAAKAQSAASLAIASGPASVPATQSAPEWAPGSAPESAPASAPRSTGALAGEPIVDWDALHARFETSTGFVERLARTVLNSESGAADELRALAAAGDLDACFRKAHAIKGPAGNLCASPLFSLAATTCRLVRADDPAAFDHIEPLIAALKSLLSELSPRLDAPNQG